IIEEMPSDVVDRILNQVDKEQRTTINKLLQYPEESAGHGGFIQIHEAVKSFIHSLEIVGVNDLHMLDSDSLHQFFDVYGYGRIALHRVTRAGILLMSRHAGDAVIQDDIYGI
ncbi:MAG: hypothetical protein II113_02175, partial [Firmicutes bacterium]|nr:hypothetical protein [Bacillota bacterium]